MEHLNIIATTLGGIILILGLGSKWLQKSPVPSTVLALGIGIILGPEVTGVLDLSALGERTRILEGVARLTLGIGLVGVALRIPRMYPRRNWREMTRFIGLAMLLMWFSSTLLVYLILPQPFCLAALIGAIITATDPVAASSIVTGPVAEENLPERIRHVISFESGANDGLGYLFVFFPFLMLTRPPEEVLTYWLTRTLLFEVGGAALMGLMIGYGAGKLLQAAEQRELIADEWRLVYTVALALFAVGIGRLIGSDEVLVVFTAGVAFVQVVSAEDRANESLGQEAVNRFFAVPIFVVLGSASHGMDGRFSVGGEASWRLPCCCTAVHQFCSFSVRSYRVFRASQMHCFLDGSAQLPWLRSTTPHLWNTSLATLSSGMW